MLNKIKETLERDLALSRFEDTTTTLKKLQAKVERLCAVFQLPASDKAELLEYTKQLLEQPGRNTQQTSALKVGK